MTNEGIGVQEVTACQFCGEQGRVRYRAVRDRLFGVPGVWDILFCPGCGLMWLNPRPIPEDISKLYANYYTHETSPSMVTLPSLPEWLTRPIFEKRLGYRCWPHGHRLQGLARPLSWMGPLYELIGGSVMWLKALPSGKLLDVGCGDGRFLAQMRALGWQVMGVEPDAEAAAIARARFGVDVTCGSLEDAAFPDSTFDAITMKHVIEHVPYPVQTLEECRRILKPGGRLVVMTPNSESIGHRFFAEAWRGLEPPRHLVLFSARTLQMCAMRAGLRIEEMRTTARMAPLIWWGSRVLHRTGLLPGGAPQHVSPWLWFEGLCFWAVEYLLAKVCPWGEELVLVASKGEGE